MQVVLSVLNLLYVFSKRSNYITRLGSDKRSPLLARLQHLAEVGSSQALCYKHCSRLKAFNEKWIDKYFIDPKQNS